MPFGSHITLAALRSLAWLFALLLLWGVPAQADDAWQGVAAAGGDVAFTPDVYGRGFALFDLKRKDVWSDADFHIHYNTDTLAISLDRLSLADGKLQLWIMLRGELIFAGLLRDYYRRGIRNAARGFDASFVQLVTRAQWHPVSHHSVELELAARKWFFSSHDDTAANFVLPPESWVFEPRLAYIYWNLDAPAREWEAHRFFPRFTGFAFRLEGGLDVRSDARGWGARLAGGLDPRNDPDRIIRRVREHLEVGVEIGQWVRIQLRQHGQWGAGEDDLSRARAGGLNPYVIPVPGLPWAALLSERLLAAQGSIHVQTGLQSRHEVGLTLAGGAFNDIRRRGRLDSFGGAGGLAPFVDLRFGAWQIHARFGWAFPADWQRDPPHLSALVTTGVRIF